MDDWSRFVKTTHHAIEVDASRGQLLKDAMTNAYLYGGFLQLKALERDWLPREAEDDEWFVEPDLDTRIKTLIDAIKLSEDDLGVGGAPLLSFDEPPNLVPLEQPGWYTWKASGLDKLVQLHLRPAGALRKPRIESDKWTAHLARLFSSRGDGLAVARRTVEQWSQKSETLREDYVARLKDVHKRGSWVMTWRAPAQ